MDATVSTESKTATVDGVEETTEWVENAGRKFYVHNYKSVKQPPAATLTIVHGLCEHIDRYEDMARAFAKAGIQVLGFDQRGFGKTGRQHGRLGDSEGNTVVDLDIEFMNRRVAIDGVPHFLFGHSMGGLNVLAYTLGKNSDGHVKGVLASAPALVAGKAILPPRIIELVLHQVVKIAPSIQKSTGITVDMMTSNQKEVERFNAGVENLSHCTLGTLSQIIKRGGEVLEKAPTMTTPVFLVHADGDKATDCEGTRKFYSNLPEALDKEFKEVKGVQYHELHFEENLDFDLVEAYTQWILARVN
ncbi:hypothetical protein GGI25_002571 [Coemansia spiralis]|uniref:Serine aminopeptidase S33 domain-containing protein n=2 Tax=Coemansia TaxID=4863 RepID=A0A9W8G3L8_9FUNG|nr:hypothetical protein EDC05_002426 [Coemansia umbellata]KAJ2622864.1 hypothetical protein GGI26_002830 [Coemansia sp. RSA 1358]KAJ2678220.1 hypothetical protein GGI25_002571 [Coemansia spiralis]